MARNLRWATCCLIVAFSVLSTISLNSHAATDASVPSSSELGAFNILQLLPSPSKKLAWFEANKFRVRTIEDWSERAKALHLVGQAYYQVGNQVKAQAFLLEARDILVATDGLNAYKGALFNDLGLIAVARKELDAARNHFQQAYETALKSKDLNLQVTSALNLGKTQLDIGKPEDINIFLNRTKVTIESLPPNAQAARHWLSLGQLYRDAAITKVLRPTARLDALSAYQSGLNIAQADKDARLQSYANGYIGQLYEDESRPEDAMLYARQALFFAQEVADDTLLYRWQWQIARLMKLQENAAGALSSYRQAVETLNRSRTQMTLGAGINFKQSVGPVFYEFADLLLLKSADMEDGDDKQSALREVIDVLEAVKLAEVEDYFDSECVLLPEQRIKLTDIKTDSAIIYPVLLQDRTELIVQLPDGVKQYTSRVSASGLRATVNRFRERVEVYDASHSYLEPAQRLYNWLVRPVEADLQGSGVTTVVFVPDGPLRSIPISALHDGQEFLVQKYAIATTPGITLTDPKPFQRDDIRVLANGLTEAVQGYSALPSVKQELANIQGIFETTLYEDKNYQLNAVEGEMSGGGYNIVHFATHGEFSSDHSKSFLLTYDDKLTMDKLESTIGLRRFQTEPIELLVLSACQTAVGDDQAALGLAGIAIKAGARSALATLWFINDSATSQLVADFYQELSQPQQSKARALQNAQVNMIAKSNYTHPSFWAPFLMIGNWL